MEPKAPIQALLLDLDGTLLHNDMDVFVSAYLEAVGRFMAGRIPRERFIPELLRATQIMAANDGDGATNEEVFAAAFYPSVGVGRAELEPLFMRFYAEEFPKLRRYTRAVDEAPQLVRWAFENGLEVVIATNPLFPLTAIEQRLDWAGVGVEDHPYRLVTSYENMHASKENPSYYGEILDRIGRSPEVCLMVGDNWAWDMANASKAGIRGWWITDGSASMPAGLPSVVGHGPLSGFLRFAASPANGSQILPGGAG